MIEKVKKPRDTTLERLSTPLGKTRIPEIKQGEYALVRNAETKDEKGWMIPPYKNAQIKMGFDNEPVIGEKVTAIPLHVKIEPFQLGISKVTKTKNSGCLENKKKEFFWAVELETIIDKEILEVERVDSNYKDQMPFAVFVIYPSVEFARSLDKSSLSKTSLPKNVTLERVSSAIDLDNDKKPDFISVYFCCGEQEKESTEECPYLCKKYYIKTAGKWQIFISMISQKSVEQK
ncbi:MAG: hypothetical protein WKF92_14960 [Pyrinomonadaceae bacterium]